MSKKTANKIIIFDLDGTLIHSIPDMCIAMNKTLEHFKLKSKDQSLPKNKRLDFDIWLDKKNSIILRVSYSRMGNWEYRLKSFE